jgi:hypothetical protein|tara:strand:- start:2332 stop:2916 length:585 start_codon:yes stop_codon:yes gene_type:complete
MTDFQSAIESILIDSNNSRIEDEISKSRFTPEDDVPVPIKTAASFVSSHIPEEEISEMTDGSDNVDNRDEDTYRDDVMDRIEFLFSDQELKKNINIGINKLICKNILKTSKVVSKIDFDIKMKDSRTILVSFGENQVEAALIDGKFIDGSEIIYVDCEGVQVDFLILRNINNNELKDITAQYRIKFNNELVPIS